MKKFLLINIILLLTISCFAQDGDTHLFTFNYGYKNFSNQPGYPHNSGGVEYILAGQRLGLAIRANFLMRGNDPHVGVGMNGKLFWGNNAPSGFYNGFGIDALFIDGRQIMPRGDIGYNIVINNFVLALEVVAGYDIGYSYSTTGYAASYFGGLFIGGEFKIGFAF